MPVVQAMTHGQNTLFSLVLLCLVVQAWRSGRALAAGLLGGLLFYKPQLAAVIAVVMVLNLGPRCLLGLAMTGGALLLINVLSLPGSLMDYLHRLPLNVHNFQAENPYLWERHATFVSFWRLLLQGRAIGEASMAVRLLSGVCCTLLGGALLAAVVRFRRCTGPRRDRLISATICAMPLLMPFYFDYDLLLLAVPAVLLAGEILRHDAGDELAPADRWLIRGWGFLFVWLFVNPAVANVTHVNLTVVLTSLVAALQVAPCPTLRNGPQHPPVRALSAIGRVNLPPVHFTTSTCSRTTWLRGRRISRVIFPTLFNRCTTWPKRISSWLCWRINS